MTSYICGIAFMALAFVGLLTVAEVLYKLAKVILSK